MPVNINFLAIEVTRRCNMACRHCLRGDAEPVDIADDVIMAALKGVGRIGELTISGGEPTLAVPRMRRVFDACREKGIGIGNVYVATNGLAVPDEFYRLMLDMYLYCDDNTTTHVKISKDKYHKEQLGDRRWSWGMNVERFEKALAFATYPHQFIPYASPEEYRRLAEMEDDLDDDSLVAQGRALGLAARRTPPVDGSIVIETDGGDVTVQEPNVYVNVRGDVLFDCDYSYDTQEELKRGNVLEECLETILRRYADKVVCPECGRWMDVPDLLMLNGVQKCAYCADADEEEEEDEDANV